MNAPSPLSLGATADIDVSDPHIDLNDTWPAYFEPRRREDPVHYTSNELFGGFWSVTRYDDIVVVDSNHGAFSSEPAITIGDYGDDVPVEQFIAMDPPKHDVQRAVVQPVVAPKNWLRWSRSSAELARCLMRSLWASLSTGSVTSRLISRPKCWPLSSASHLKTGRS